jgi:hypothetical protein
MVSFLSPLLRPLLNTSESDQSGTTVFGDKLYCPMGLKSATTEGV